MKEIENNFLDSLDLDDSEIIPFVPEILKDLWELGSIPKYIIELVEKHILPTQLKNVIDLGCGKGAVLIQLSERIKFEGVGIDIMPDFIIEANKRSKQKPYAKNLKFEIGDIKNSMEKHHNFDLVIYGHDSDIFGNITQSLIEINKYSANNRWIILEAIYSINSTNNPDNLPNYKEFIQQLKESEFEIIEQVNWNKNQLKQVNSENTSLISKQIKNLIKTNPNKEKMFTDYLKNQIEECHQLENDITCLTILLKNNSNVTQQ
jgi:ubiquinone/menaquinone biosynthesis C-methylase UbiE